MNLDEHPYLLIYLVGCAVAFCLSLVVVAEAYVIGWVFKGNIMRKNLKKIQDPESTNFKIDAAVFVFGLVTGTLMSWLGVVQYLWRILWMPLSALREVFSSVPEEIKLLQFPLKNNPNLSREAVFAYAYALGVRAGTSPNAWQMAQELQEIEGYYPSFNSEVALNTLSSLGVVTPEVISWAASYVGDEKKP